ncbi:EAL domain-containing protein [Acidiferrobacter sp.]|uniref:EAL domain-containing protein n=1 Tax=Acidiferrobacter sp. TaxID=1872107 RepID=UPI00260E9B5E|nr:EAL domain-containing protein [Acidiferrobacter sp.]
MTSHDAYGPRAAKSLTLIRPHADLLTREICAMFHDDLLTHAGRDDILAQLNAEEFWASQEGHPLGRLLDPDLKHHALRQSAQDMGRTLAYLGVENTWLVDTFDTLIIGLRRHPLMQSLPHAKQTHIQDILVSRLMASLSGIVAGQRQIIRGQLRVTSAVARLAKTCTTLNDLARALLETLLTLEGMVAGTFAKPDKNGTLQYEIVAGATVERHASTFADYQSLPNIYADNPLGCGPSGCAWRSGKPQRSLIITREPSLAPWHRIARELGYVSHATIPILDANREPHAILSLYHAAPGYFSTADRTNLVDRLHAVLSAAVTRLGRDTPAVHYTIRADYRERLAQGALTMLYQPIIDLKTGRLAKVEALARLRNPDGTHIPPLQFLPAFGAHDLRRLFALGLNQAMADLHEWEHRGLYTAISVNLPAQALSDPEYLSIAQAALHDRPIEPHRLTFELLETGDISPQETAVRRLTNRWRRLGVRLAQDDLGSGYSSLLRMERLGVDEVKIDQEFVRTVARSPRKALQFIHHLTRLVHDIGLSVVVEGLESRGLVEAATILGADAGQGYAISRPITANALSIWHRDFDLAIVPESPTTALGAYATLLLRGVLLNLARSRPALLRHVISEPCAIAAYMENAAIPKNSVLKDVYRKLADVIRAGADPQRYEKTHKRLERLLRMEIRREEDVMADSRHGMGGASRIPLPYAP